MCRDLAERDARRAQPKVRPPITDARIERIQARADKQARDRAERIVDQAQEVADRKMRFLTELTQNGGHVERACKAAGVTRAMMGRYRDDDDEFALAWEAVQETNVERLETEADRRALGYEEPVIYQGQRMGRWVTPDGKPASMADDNAVFVPTVVTRYSDNLLMFRLKALRPEKYRDGPGNKPGTQMSEDELDEALARMMARRKAKDTEPIATEHIN